MKVGTKSVLFGAHCFFIHPWFVALAWFRLYGFRQAQDPYLGGVSLLDPRLWLAFFIHDLGYWCKSDMDGEEGETHPAWGARTMTLLFDRRTFPGHERRTAPDGTVTPWLGPWGRFAFYHSRFLSKRYGAPYSLLCVADKLSVALEPWWLYLPRVIATGEIREYMALAGGKGDSKYKGEPNTKYESMGLETGTVRDWHQTMTSYCKRWALAHRDGVRDTWTPERAA